MQYLFTAADWEHLLDEYCVETVQLLTGLIGLSLSDLGHPLLWLLKSHCLTPERLLTSVPAESSHAAGSAP